jgi:hypothetical protein
MFVLGATVVLRLELIMRRGTVGGLVVSLRRFTMIDWGW